MSGSAGMRGYLLQALVCLIDGLRADRPWTEVAIEPHNSSDKVDILWRRKSHTRAVQVKSSQNQIALPDAERWASDLRASVSADEYELILLGPCSQAVASASTLQGVQVPTPRILDPLGLIDQASHCLDRYLESKAISRIPSFARELIVTGLVTKLEVFSTSGAYLALADFEKTISDWILALYPQSFSEAVEMQCDVLLDSIIIPGPSLKEEWNESFPLLLPMQFVNGGVRTAIIEWVAIRVQAPDHAKLYTPVALIDIAKFMQGKHQLHGENLLACFRNSRFFRAATFRQVCFSIRNLMTLGIHFVAGRPGNTISSCS